MNCTPEIVLNRTIGKPKLSIILLDWGVRESFHSLHYLNRQTVARGEYEIIWLEFYNRKPAALSQLVTESDTPVLDKWLVLGYADELIYNKHRLYNIGILASAGEVCVICDSDAIFSPTFVENVIKAFEETPNQVIHLDEVRNEDPRFYPFNHPTLKEVLGPGCSNWHKTTTRGLIQEHDRLHRANYGACMAARRKDILAVGGADEHLDYLGYVCGPYDLTFRLVNHYGQPERWLNNEYLYHTWHPNESGINTDYHGPHDGRFMSLRSLDARSSFRVQPCVANPWMSNAGPLDAQGLRELMQKVQARPEPTWRAATLPAAFPDVYWSARSWVGFNIFTQACEWFALPEHEQAFDPHKARAGEYPVLLRADSLDALEADIRANYEQLYLQHEKGRWRRLLRNARAQPLHRLPMRVWRRTQRLLSRIMPPSPPWQPTSIESCAHS